MAATLLVSDLHLAPARPALLAAFHRFCAREARDADTVYILGDLFDAWIGDDQLREPAAAAVAQSLRTLAATGVRIGVMRGNRDFLLGEDFARAVGATLLPEQVVVDIQGTPTLLLHGDELCTGDLGYQRFRAWSRQAAWQRRFLSLPYGARRVIAGALRRESRRATSGKAEMIMDVAPDAVTAVFRRHGIARLIHGHTHRPAHHDLAVDGRARERWVLADWYQQGSYLECRAGAITVRDIGD